MVQQSSAEKQNQMAAWEALWVCIVEVDGWENDLSEKSDRA